MIYPEIAKMMAIKKMNQTDLAKIIGVTQQAASKKLKGTTDFKRGEMIAIKEYFEDIDPNITMDSLFSIFLNC